MSSTCPQRRGPQPIKTNGERQPAAEIRRLQRENEYLRRQREILKKAMSILSEAPPSGMP